jgi:periplasmic protein TonB
MAAAGNIFLERENWRDSLLWSAAAHVFFFGGIFIYAAIFGGMHAENWGGTASEGGAMSATLVSSAALPLPAPEIQTEQVLSNESRGLTQSLEPKVQPPAPEDIPIPDRTKPKPKQKQQTSVMPPRIPPPEENVVPYGEGGPVTAHYTMVNVAGSQGGLSFNQGGDFGSKYAWYVNVVRQKVSENWRRYEIDPTIPSAPRVYITFEITRSGEPQNVRVEQSSGIPSLDISAVRALQRIDTFGPLPADYSGSRVSVEFWFEYKK